MASRFYDITGMGYVGVDIVLDKDLGPMLLEVNARPGIAIQVANKTGMQHRLKFVRDYPDSFEGPQQRAEFAIRHFAHDAPQLGSLS